MAPKRKSGGGRGGGRGKKAKTEVPQASGPPDLTGKETYCSEVGIDIENGGSQAVFQWLCCSIIFGNRISEKVRNPFLTNSRDKLDVYRLSALPVRACLGRGVLALGGMRVVRRRGTTG